MGWIQAFKRAFSGGAGADPAAPVREETAGACLAREMAQEAAGFAAALGALGYRADFTVESLEELERFFQEETGPNGILTGACEGRLKGLAAYLGESLRQAWGGAWEDGEDGPRLRLENGAVRDVLFTVRRRWETGEGEPFAAYAVRAGQSGD